MMRHGIFAMLICSMVVGCVSSNFTTVESPYTAPGNLFTVSVPAEWHAYKPDSKDSSLVVTHDGLELQYIRVALFTPLSKLAHTSRTISKGMMPQELADLFLDDMKSNHTMMNLEILDNQPAPINGHEGFQVTYRYATPDGLKKRGVLCGYMTGLRVYIIQYAAAEKVYYPKDIGVFESIKASLQ